MAVYKSKGVVLRSIRYGEADRILDLYTLDRGLISAIAKGVRRTKSRFGARLEPLSCIELVAYEGRSLDTITQVSVLKSFSGVRSELARLEAAGGMVRAIRAFSEGDEADRRIFNLLYRSLDALEQRSEDYRSVEAAFVMKLSMLAGYAPDLAHCVGCGADLAATPNPDTDNETSGEDSSGVPYFSPGLGGMLCRGCRSSSGSATGPSTGGAFPVAPETNRQLAVLASLPVREASLRSDLAGSARRVIESHVQAHAPGTRWVS